MKISIKNLGVLKQASFNLNDLTIICGKNNTGKTYATYALYGFMSFFRENFSDFPLEIPEKHIQSLLRKGSVELDINEYIGDIPSILESGCDFYSENLPDVFAGFERYFSESSFSVTLNSTEISPKAIFKKTWRIGNTGRLSIAKTPRSRKIAISLLWENAKLRPSSKLIKRLVTEALKDIVLGNFPPRPFIASTERTGAAIFRKELDFSRNRLLEEMNAKNVNPKKLLSEAYTNYAWPVKANVNFARQLESLVKSNSFIEKEHPEILDNFSDIIGGEYLVTDHDELYYIPKNKRVKLTMSESSSAVRSLLDIGFYLRHVAEHGDILMIDEPELNLHPENQRRMAKLFVRLINIGVKVFITTHSDYIIKELNTLIMLNQNDARLKDLAKREGYKPSELLNPEKVSVYIAKKAPVRLNGSTKISICHTLVPADIDDKLGIDAPSFDETIEDMNRIQDEIFWGEEE